MKSKRCHKSFLKILCTKAIHLAHLLSINFAFILFLNLKINSILVWICVLLFDKSFLLKEIFLYCIFVLRVEVSLLKTRLPHAIV